MHKQLRTFRLETRLGLGLAVLLLSVPLVASAGAAPDNPPPEQSRQGDEHGADPAQERPRKKPVEPQSRPASPDAMRAGTLKCGDVITRSTTLTLDVRQCAGDGIIIGADNITLNLNGHTISGARGPGSGNEAGIRLPNRRGVTITGLPSPSDMKGTVTGFDAGVFINGGSGNSVENLIVRDNIGPDGEGEPTLSDGIALFHSANNRIVNNVIARNGRYDGIGVLGVDSNDNLIEGNRVEDTVASAGDFVLDGQGIIITNFLDEFDTPRRGEPVSNNHVINNVVRRNDNSGISNITNIGARIVGNRVEDNGQRGERCGGFFGCQPAAISSNGIGFTAGPLAPRITGALIEGNTVTGNTGNGIELQTQENRVVGNTARANGGSDARFDLLDRNCCPPTCDANVWSDNVFNTANPLCTTGGLGSVEGPYGDPTCSDRRDNDFDGHIDEADFGCQPPQEGPQ